jgi:hypothetical protein
MKRLLLLGVLGVATPAAAWGQPAATAEQMVEVDPIRCWWRTTAGAVRIGETFGLTLTCAVLDNEAVQVVPDESRLGGAVISMAPFEVVASAHPQDLRGGERRFFQYDYTLRIINPDAIGQDVGIPIISLHYRISSRIAANASVQGRDLTYILPPQSMRILSMVPADAPDIRDSSDERFSNIEALTLRAGMLDALAITLAALGVLMVAVVLVRLVAGVRKGAGVAAHVLGTYTVLRHAGRELAAVERVADQGWTSELAGRALAATRIAASVALGRAVSQRAVQRSAVGPEIVAKPLFGRGVRTALSSSATAASVAAAIARLPESAAPERRQLLESLQSALTTFDRTQYGPGTEFDRAALDAALSSAIAATSRLKSEHMWPKPYVRRWTMRAPEPEHQT